MQILESAAEIKVAIALMNPVARAAAQSLAGHLLDNPDALEDSDAFFEAYCGASGIAMQEHGMDLKDEKLVEQFFNLHGEAVRNVAVSIVAHVIKDAQRQRKWGWLGKAAAFVAGVTIASFFG